MRSHIASHHQAATWRYLLNQLAISEADERMAGSGGALNQAERLRLGRIADGIEEDGLPNSSTCDASTPSRRPTPFQRLLFGGRQTAPQSVDAPGEATPTVRQLQHAHPSQHPTPAPHTPTDQPPADKDGGPT